MWDLISETKPTDKTVQDVSCHWQARGALAEPGCNVGKQLKAKFLINLAEAFVYCPYCGKQSKVKGRL